MRNKSRNRAFRKDFHMGITACFKLCDCDTVPLKNMDIRDIIVPVIIADRMPVFYKACELDKTNHKSKE